MRTLVPAAICPSLRFCWTVAQMLIDQICPRHRRDVGRLVELKGPGRDDGVARIGIRCGAAERERSRSLLHEARAAQGGN